MFDCFLSQLLALALIVSCCVRIFFIKKEKVDSFAVASPCALVISLITFFCFEFSLLSMALFILSLLVFATNFRSILRLRAKLIVDHYSTVFIITTLVELLLAVALIVCAVLLKPVRYYTKDFNDVEKTEFTLTGDSFTMRIRNSVTDGKKSTGKLYLYEPKHAFPKSETEHSPEHPVLVFAGTTRGTVMNYEPYLLILAQKGFSVLAADIYTADTEILSDFYETETLKTLAGTRFLRRFFSLLLEQKDSELFESFLEREQEIATKKYSSLTRLSFELFGDKTNVFYITDGLDLNSIQKTISEFSDSATGFFSMNRIPEYNAPGCGFIEQTDILLAYTKGIKREKMLFIPRYVALKTTETVRESATAFHERKTENSES